MTTSQLVGQHVPYLRRYARILTGNQASGDSYVAATLEVLVKEPLAEHPRIALYQVFSRIWNSISRRRNAMSARLPRCPDRHSYLSRSKGFPKRTRLRFSTSIKKGCRILVDESGREIAAQIATDVLIIEDEMVIALDLEQLVEKLGHRTIGIARTRAEAIELS